MNQIIFTYHNERCHAAVMESRQNVLEYLYGKRWHYVGDYNGYIIYYVDISNNSAFNFIAVPCEIRLHNVNYYLSHCKPCTIYICEYLDNDNFIKVEKHPDGTFTDSLPDLIPKCYFDFDVYFTDYDKDAKTLTLYI